MTKHILINSYIRSGGSLLARLLDSHPDLYVLPIEMSYSKRKVLFPASKTSFNAFDDLVQYMNLERTFKKLDRNGVISKDPYGKQLIEFSYASFLNALKHKLDHLTPIQLSDSIPAIYDSFFENWGDLKKQDNVFQNKNGYVNHLSAMCYGDHSEYFDLFPKGKIIQTVRDPRSWYASVKSHFGISDDHQVFLTFAMCLWSESSIRGLIAAKQRPNEYALIRYEDIVVNLDETLNGICEFLCIDYNEALNQPTMGGVNWKGNSSYGQKNGVDDSGLNKWETVLTKSEINDISKITHEVSNVLGYTDSELKNVLWDCDELSLSMLGIDVSLNVENEAIRYKQESLRMTAIMHVIFHEKMTRSIGKRYQKKNIFVRLMNRIKQKN